MEIVVGVVVVVKVEEERRFENISEAKQQMLSKVIRWTARISLC